LEELPATEALSVAAELESQQRAQQQMQLELSEDGQVSDNSLTTESSDINNPTTDDTHTDPIE
jgi:hypothetical protein